MPLEVDGTEKVCAIRNESAGAGNKHGGVVHGGGVIATAFGKRRRATALQKFTIFTRRSRSGVATIPPGPTQLWLI